MLCHLIGIASGRCYHVIYDIILIFQLCNFILSGNLWHGLIDPGIHISEQRFLQPMSHSSAFDKTVQGLWHVPEQYFSC